MLHVYCEKYVEIPGWYRPEKKWDLLVVADNKLLAGIEFKSQVGSFGNNYNNRTEEAIAQRFGYLGWPTARALLSLPRVRGSAI